MDKVLEALNTLTNAVKNLQLKISRIEAVSKTYTTKKDLDRAQEKLRSKFDDITKQFRILEDHFKRLKQDVDSKVTDLDNSFRVLKSQISGFASAKDVAKISLDISEINSRVDNVIRKLVELEELSIKINELDTKIKNINEKIKLLNNLQEKNTEFENKFKDIEKKEKEITTDINLLKERLNILESELQNTINALYDVENNINDVISTKIKEYEADISESLNQISERLMQLNFLNDITRKDIEKLKRLPENFDEIFKKFSEIESQILTVNEIMEGLKSVIHSIKTRYDVDKFLSLVHKLENKLNDVEKAQQNIVQDVQRLYKELRDIDEMIVMLSADRDKLEKKLINLETKIKIENLEEVLEAVERIKLLEDDIKKLKMVVQGNSMSIMSPEKEMYLRIQKLENAIRKLYEQQNSTLSLIFDKLNKLESNLRR